MFVNPAATRGRRQLGEARTILARHFDLVVHDTTSAEAMFELAARESRQGCGLIIAGGGDGTINVIVNAIAGTGATLGILPMGTANDFARQLGLAQNLEVAARRIVSGRLKNVDVIAVNGRRFCTVGGLGLVTECAMSANRLKAAGHPLRPIARCFGSAIYPVVAVAKILLGGRCTWDLNLEWTEPGNKKSATLRATLHGMFFANQRVLGGALTLPADSCNDDGLVDLCVMHAGHRLRLLGTVLALRTARPVDRRVISVHRASRVRIESGIELGFLGDGELLCAGRHFELEVIAGGLPVIC